MIRDVVVKSCKVSRIIVHKSERGSLRKNLNRGSDPITVPCPVLPEKQAVIQ
jgi:hypothetical protein